MVLDTGAVRARAGDELLKMWRVQVPPGKRMLQRHSHTRFEIMTVLKGSGVYTVNSGTHVFSSGDVFVFSGNEFHCITEVGADGLEILNLHFEPRYFLSDVSDDIDNTFRNFCFAHSSAFENRIPAEKADAIRQLLLEIRRELEQSRPGYALAVKSLLNMIAVHLVRCCGYAQEHASLSQSECILNAIAYIDEHFSESLSLNDIAGHSGLSPNYFSTLFRRVCNISLWDYVTAKRIEKAIRLIGSNTGGSMLEIAMACGFNNTANFNRAFRAQTGMTPSQYKNTDDIIIHQ